MAGTMVLFSAEYLTFGAESSLNQELITIEYYMLVIVEYLQISSMSSTKEASCTENSMVKAPCYSSIKKMMTGITLWKVSSSILNSMEMVTRLTIEKVKLTLSKWVNLLME